MVDEPLEGKMQGPTDIETPESVSNRFQRIGRLSSEAFWTNGYVTERYEHPLGHVARPYHEEPDALIAQVRICGGWEGGRISPFYPTRLSKWLQNPPRQRVLCPQIG